MNISRREAVIKMALMMGASVVGPQLLGAQFGKADAPAPGGYSAADLALLDEIGETIIPATKTPGAKAVGIGAFIVMMVSDCYRPGDQKEFRDGLAKLAQDYQARYQEPFVTGQLKNRLEFLNELDGEQRKHTAAINRARPKTESYETGAAYVAPAPHYFRVMRELTLLGFYTSEVGSLQVLRYLEVPGRYDGNVPYKKGDEWFT